MSTNVDTHESNYYTKVSYATDNGTCSLARQPNMHGSVLGSAMSNAETAAMKLLVSY